MCVSIDNTWDEALGFDLPGVAEADGAVGVRVGQQPLRKVINPLVQLVWDVGCLEWGNNHNKQ